MLASLGWLARAQGDVVRATQAFEKSLALSRERGGKLRVASSLLGLGVVSLDQRDLARAATLLGESLRLADELENIAVIAVTLEWLACLAATTGHDQQGAMVLGAADALRTIHAVPPGFAERAGQERLAAAIRANLGESVFAEQWTAGQHLRLDQAIARGLTIVSDAPASMKPPTIAPAPVIDPVTPFLTHELTPRELEVLRLLAEGRSDRDIAGALSISPLTVGGHVTHLLAKLGVETRTAAVAHALRNGLA